MLKKYFIILLIIILSAVLISCWKESSLKCSYPLKQIMMCDAETGWALSIENEILFTQNGIENFKPIKQMTDINEYTDGFMSASFLDEQTAYVTYFAPGNEYLAVEYTRNGGDDWNQTLIKYANYAQICDAGSAFISFADDKNGYLLYCSTPSLGQMTKLLFYTKDGGENFLFAGNLTDKIEGYPQGVTFANEKIGYIAVTYHGNAHYMYMTSDGAETWESIEVSAQSEKVNYIDGFSPVFSARNKQEGMLVLKEVSGEQTTYKAFLTSDMGNTWEEKGEITCSSLLGYSLVSNAQFYLIDGMGSVQAIGHQESLKQAKKNLVK